MTDWKARLKALGPCPEAYRWAIKHKTFRPAGRSCEDGNWMWWLIDQKDPNGSWEMDDLLIEVGNWGDREDDVSEASLREASIILDFMPDPPCLPEIA